MNGRYREKTLQGAYRITLPAMLLALTLVFIYLSSVVTVVSVSFLFIASIFVSALMVEREPILATIVFFAATILGFVIVSDKMRMIPYVLFFGHYGIVKYYIEKIRNVVLRYAVKLAYFNAAVIAAYFIIPKLLISADISAILPPWALLLIAQPIFVIYDVVFSWIANYYYRNIRKHLIRDGRGRRR